MRITLRTTRRRPLIFAASALFSGIELYQPSPFDKIQAEEYKIIREIAAEDSCVIVGRGADYILRDQSHVSIFLFAPLEDRVKRKLALLSGQDAKNMTPAQMEKIVKQMDKQRRRYYEYYTDTKWGDRDSYDLLINTSRAGYRWCSKDYQDIHRVESWRKHDARLDLISVPTLN